MAPAQNETKAQIPCEENELDYGNTVAIGEDSKLIQHCSLATCEEVVGVDLEINWKNRVGTVEAKHLRILREYMALLDSERE